MIVSLISKTADEKKLSEIKKTAFPVEAGYTINEAGVFFPNTITPDVLYWLETYPLLNEYNQKYSEIISKQSELIEVENKIITNYITETKIQKIFITNCEIQTEKLRLIHKLDRRIERRSRTTVNVISILVSTIGGVVTGYGLATGNEPVSYIGLGGIVLGGGGMATGNIIVSFKHRFKK